MFNNMLFLFCIGSIGGWILELFFRRFTSENKKWINPGYLVGPYLLLYGFGLNIFFLIARCQQYICISNAVVKKIVVILLMGAAATLLEYITGLIFIKRLNVKLWDYSGEFGNVQGIICPLFSVLWTVLCAVYYLLIHFPLTELLKSISTNIYCVFFLGAFYGIFIVDLFYSGQILIKVRNFAKVNSITVKLEEWKESMIALSDGYKKKRNFLFILPPPGKVRYSLTHFHKNYNENKKRSVFDIFKSRGK